MAATFTINKHTNFGNAFARQMTMTGDTAYPAGGYAVTALACDLPSLGYVYIMDGVSAAGYVWRYDSVNVKLMAYSILLSIGTTQLTQATTGIDMSAEIIKFMAVQGN